MAGTIQRGGSDLHFSLQIDSVSDNPNTEIQAFHGSMAFLHIKPLEIGDSLSRCLAAPRFRSEGRCRSSEGGAPIPRLPHTSSVPSVERWSCWIHRQKEQNLPCGVGQQITKQSIEKLHEIQLMFGSILRCESSQVDYGLGLRSEKQWFAASRR
jgi:hypothetical protein